MVRLTCLTLQVSRSAICPTFLTVPATNSSSHCRPFAIAVTRLARVSDRIGRVSVRVTERVIGRVSERVSERVYRPVIGRVIGRVAARVSARVSGRAYVGQP